MFVSDGINKCFNDEVTNCACLYHKKQRQQKEHEMYLKMESTKEFRKMIH